MDLENMEMQPDLDIVNTSDLISSNKENIPSNESHAPAEPEVSEAPPGPSLPAMITIEPPSPSIVEMSDNPLHAEANSTKSESVTEAAENALAAASSTPTLTVRERVREFTSRAGGGDQPDGNSLSSSHSSIRGARIWSSNDIIYETPAPASATKLIFEKDDKEWILAASAADINAMRKMLATVGGSTGSGGNSCKRMVNYRFPFNGFTALHFAAKLDNARCCQFLLENGADPDAKTYAGQTPLHLAYLQECRKAVELLLKQPCRASHTPDYSGKLPHELIRNREAFSDILSDKSTAPAMEKRGSFLGELPSNRSYRGDDGGSFHGAIAGGGGGGGAAALSSSWLSGVRASFRGKSGSQPKLSHQTGRVASIRNKGD
ncbi:hypothetical protein BOX15_Mlig015587g1 [Macrostomum lignano]|uniref:Uncharacterized protein n=1 Tax=Macrostomum lignano TaxID=282301 RepID=A0A267H974_9PLAT|nr:hypothetical protein BOX15_Mlig015587g1 [Macrostomum lignano]